MNKTHFLVKKAIAYSRNRIFRDPENCEFSNRLGLWLWGDKKEILVKAQNPHRPRTGTKKNDLETGEDEKGE